MNVAGTYILMNITYLENLFYCSRDTADVKIAITMYHIL
jgi:hypothetical protein